MNPLHVILRLLFVLISTTPLLVAAEPKLQVNVDQAVDVITSKMREDIITNLYEGAENQLKSATYFEALLEPYSKYVDPSQNFTTKGLEFYRSIQEDTKEMTPEQRQAYFQENFEAKVTGYVQQMVYDKIFDTQSQEIISGLQSMLGDAQERIQNMGKLQNALDSAESSAEYTAILKEYGVNGKWVDDFEALEENINLIRNSKIVGDISDAYQAYSIVSNAMNSKNPGHKIEALFELGATFGGKVPILGDFIKIYFEVAQEYLKLCKGVADKLRKFDQNCVGGGTHAQIEGLYSDVRNVAFSNQFQNDAATYCRGAGGIYLDIYSATSETGTDGSKLLFWVDGRWVVGAGSKGGMNSVQAMVRWLRANGHSDKTTDVAYLAKEYNKGQGYKHFIFTITAKIAELRNAYLRVYNKISHCDAKEVESYMMLRAQMQRLSTFLKRLDYNFDSIKYFGSWLSEDIKDEYIYRRLIRPEGADTLGIDTLIAHLNTLDPRCEGGHIVEGDEHSDPFEQIRADFAKLKALAAEFDPLLAQITEADTALQELYESATKEQAGLSALAQEAIAMQHACKDNSNTGDPQKIAQMSAASNADLITLKEHSIAAADAKSAACNHAKQVRSDMFLDECDTLASHAKESANISRKAANKAILIAGVIAGRYQNLLKEQRAIEQRAQELASLLGSIEAASKRALPVRGDTVDVSDALSQLLDDADSLAADIRRGLYASSLDEKNLAQAEGQLTAALGSVYSKASGVESAQKRYHAKITAFDALIEKIEALKSTLEANVAPLKACQAPTAMPQSADLRSAADTAEIFGPYADSKALEAHACATKAAGVCAQIQPCESNLDCPLDKICEGGICVVLQNGVGFDADGWNERESDRESEVGDRRNQDADSGWGENSSEFTNETMQEGIQNTLTTLTTRSSSHDDESDRWPHSEASQSSVSSSTSVATSSERSSTSSVSTVSSTATGATSSISGLYYTIKEVSSYLERTANCTAVTYHVVGPFDAKAINSYVKQRQIDNKKKIGIKRYPLYTKITVSKSKGSESKPAAPASARNCTPCPAGQHIGLDANKRHCHAN